MRISDWSSDVCSSDLRLYRNAGLAVRKRRKRDRVAVERRPLQVPSRPNHTWSMDFVFDALANGRPIKCLTMVDDCTKEAGEIAVGQRINGQRPEERSVGKEWASTGRYRRSAYP